MAEQQNFSTLRDWASSRAPNDGRQQHINVEARHQATREHNFMSPFDSKQTDVAPREFQSNRLEPRSIASRGPLFSAFSALGTWATFQSHISVSARLAAASNTALFLRVADECEKTVDSMHELPIGQC
jgi:hypothetical protein